MSRLIKVYQVLNIYLNYGKIKSRKIKSKNFI